MLLPGDPHFDSMYQSLPAWLSHSDYDLRITCKSRLPCCLEKVNWRMYLKLLDVSGFLLSLVADYVLRVLHAEQQNVEPYAAYARDPAGGSARKANVSSLGVPRARSRGIFHC